MPSSPQLLHQGDFDIAAYYNEIKIFLQGIFMRKIFLIYVYMYIDFGVKFTLRSMAAFMPA